MSSLVLEELFKPSSSLQFCLFVSLPERFFLIAALILNLGTATLFECQENER